jgi:antitoxin (DNA-binding transcriptional repressor) of toxin-antitoxin stability system
LVAINGSHEYNMFMSNISLQELAHDPAALLDRVQAGEHIVVIREGRPVAELRPVMSPHSTVRPFGLAAGTFTVPDDFDSPLPPDILREFEGR